MTAYTDFYPYFGDLMGLPTDKNHLNFRWVPVTDCKILFSISRQGNGASCHFASDKAGMKKIRIAINEFCEFIFNTFLWCEMIIAKINREKVINIVKDCGFEKLLEYGKKSIYIKPRRIKWDL